MKRQVVEIRVEAQDRTIWCNGIQTWGYSTYWL